MELCLGLRDLRESARRAAAARRRQTIVTTSFPPTRRGRVAASLAAACGLALACGPGEAPARHDLPTPSNLLLVTIDTLRADHLSAYGYPRPTSPVLDRLAAEGVRFDRPAVQWPKTGPSFASMFTATYSKDNGVVRRIGTPVPLEYSLLAEVLAEHGYATGAVVSNGAVASEFNFDQGFAHYVETWKSTDAEGDPNRASLVTDAALDLAARLDPGTPYFLWVHYLDPHFPYTPPPAFADRFVGDEHYDPAVRIDIHYHRQRQQMTGIGRDQVLDGRDELAFYQARYDAEILYTDTEIGRLLETLGADGRLERTLVAVTADHGESLGEHHYYFDHGRFSFQTCLRVPLILHYPEVLAPRVDAAPVELIDLAPTLLEFAGVELEDGAWHQGESLVARLLGRDGSGEPALAFSEAGYASEAAWQRVVQDERFKLVRVRAENERRWLGGDDEPWVLYDLATDPGETVNRARDLPDEVRRLKLSLAAWLDADPFPLGGRASSQEGEMDDETRRQLEALGYLQ
jgi:arylsulfatase A-like enzyme